MSDTKKVSAIRNFINALCKKDIDGAMTFFAEGATWSSTEGTFTGADAIREYTQWMVNSLSGLSFTDAGAGIIVAGNNAMYEYTMSGTFEGKKIETPGVCVYQFEGDTCVRHFTLVDRLSMAKQAAGGFIAKKAVKSIIGIMEKGLH